MDLSNSHTSCPALQSVQGGARKCEKLLLYFLHVDYEWILQISFGMHRSLWLTLMLQQTIELNVYMNHLAQATLRLQFLHTLKDI